MGAQSKRMRVQGDKTVAYTQTLNNQVGPDTATQSDRTITAMTDLNTKFWDKTGGPGGTGTAADPYLTPTQAIDAAVAAGGAFVMAGCQDSETYIENIDLKGVGLYSVDGQAPILEFDSSTNYLSLNNTLTSPWEFIEWAISGVNYLIATCSNGVYRSSDGGVTWALWVLNGKSCKGMTLYNDGSGEALFIANETDMYLTKVTSAGGTSTFNDFSSDMNGFYDVTNVNGVIVVGGGFNAGTSDSNIYYYSLSTGTWTGLSSSNNSSRSIVKISYNTEFSLTKAICAGSTYINDVLTEGVFELVSNGIAITSFTHKFAVTTAGGQDIGLFLRKNNVYVSNQTNLFINKNYLANSGSFYDAGITLLSTTSTAQHRGIFEDKRGWIYIANYSNIQFSNNNGLSFSTLTTPSSEEVKDFIEHDGRLITSNAGTVTNNLLYQEASIVRDSVGAGVLNGLILNCTDSIFGAAGFADLNIEWCDLKNAIYCAEDLSNNQLTIKNSKLYDSLYGAWKDDNTLTFTNNAYYNITNAACRQANGTIDYEHNTSFNCGYGFRNDGNLTITNLSNSIIHKSSIADIYSAEDITGNANFDYMKFNTTAGGFTITPFANQFTANPLFINEVTLDLDLKHVGSGYLFNSQYVKDGAGEASDDKALGAYDTTYAVSSTTYGIDYTVEFNPWTKIMSGKAYNYQANYNPNGEYNENWNGFKKVFNIAWGKDQIGSTAWQKQAFTMLDIFNTEDASLRVGRSTDEINWASYRENSSSTVAGASRQITISYDGEYWSKNQWQGYWILIDSIYYRIESHPAKADSGTCVLTLALLDETGADSTTTLPASGSYAWAIDYILIKIDHSKDFVHNVDGYNADTEFDPVNARKITGYGFVAREQENE